MAEKCLDEEGHGLASHVASAIYHATDSGAKIISMSLGLCAHSNTLYEAIEYAYNNNVLVVAAAGNDNVTGKHYPAGYDEVIAVAATDQYDNKAWFSNWGDWIELAAPGVDIYSTKPGGYRYANGTSMAAPYVSGVAALILSQYPNMTRDVVRGQLRWTVDDLGSNGFDEIYGWGRINAREAVEEEQSNHDLGIIEWDAPHSSQPGQTIYIDTSVITPVLATNTTLR
jgi:subtilisin family serine protease